MTKAVTLRLRIDPRALRQLKMQRAALEQIRAVLLMNDRLLRANGIRIAMAAGATADDRRRHKRADRLYHQVLRDWERHTGKPIDSIGKALVEIYGETRQMHNVLKMLSAGMTLNFKPKVIVE